VTDSIRVGIRAGLVLSVLGIVFALPTLSATIRVATLVNGGGGWLVLTANLIPLVCFAVLGGLAKRRGLSGGSVGLWAGIVYGLVYGAALYLVDLLTPHKRALATLAWNAYLAHGYPLTPTARQALTAPIVHPQAFALIGGTGLELALVGLVAGFAGGLFTRRPSQDKS
jgi:hypothetical protein